MATDASTLPRFLNLGDLPPGFVLRDLTIEARIGRGGFGVVYRARRGDRLYAVKLPLLELSSTDERARTAAKEQLPRVDREIASLKALKHPNVITVTEFFPWDPGTNEVDGADGLPIIVMPFVDGPPLDTWVETAKPPLRTILTAVRDIGSALAEVHKRSFVHRDLKPSNILVEGQSKPVLIDFGIAKGKSVYTATGKGELIGTVDFFAPEYALYCTTRDFRAGKPFPYGPPQDIYALGHTLYFVLTGASAWAAYNDILSDDLSLEFLEVLKSGVIPPPSDINPRIPKDVDALVLTMLERDKSDRYQNGLDVVEAVEALFAAHPSPDAAYDEPFSLPTDDERAQRVRDSAELLSAESAEGPPPPPPSALAEAPALALPPTASLRKGATPTRAARGPDAASKPTVPVSPRAVAEALARASATKAPAGPGTHDFRPPSVGREVSFESPVAAVPLAADEHAPYGADLPLPSALQRLKVDVEEQRRPSPAKSPWLWGVAGAVAVLAVLALVGLSRRPSPSEPKSLLAAVETDAPTHPEPKPLATAPALPPSPTLTPTLTPTPTPTSTPTSNAERLAVQHGTAASPGERNPEPEQVRHPVEGTSTPPPTPTSPSPSPSPQRTTRPPPRNPDAAEVDAELAKEFGGQRPVLPPGAPAPAAPAAGPALPAFAMRAVGAAAPAAPTGPRRLGIPLGTEVPARLEKPLDSRLASGLVVARLPRSFALRGELVLPSGTMLYGASSASAQRFDVTFTRLKLPDGTELPFKGVAYDGRDKKPGLSPSRHLAPTQAQGPGLGEAVARAGASAALNQLGGDAAGNAARTVAQTALNHGGTDSSGAGQEALLLDAPTDFTLFITEAF